MTEPIFLRKIHTESDVYEQVQQLMHEAFPPVERRSDEAQIYRLDTDERFQCVEIRQADRFAGFITWWTFSQFAYIEHFAVSSAMRGSGIGRTALTLFCRHVAKPVVLEVERPNPDDRNTLRRIEFYRSQKFTLWDKFDYVQPPYESQYPSVGMFLMTHGKIVPTKENFEMIRSALYENVYGVR